MGSRPTEATATTAAAPPGASAGAPTSSAHADEGFAGQQERDGSSGGPTPPTRPGELSERNLFRISLVRNAHYHEDRERFFARAHRVAMFVVVASGTASFAFVK